MVKGMHGRAYLSVAIETGAKLPLDALRLDLHVHGGSIADHLQHVIESWHGIAGCEVTGRDNRERLLAKRYERGAARSLQLHCRIMMHDHHPVGRAVHVKLDTVRSQLDGARECPQGIFPIFA